MKGDYCLGIESTADDFSVGIVSFDGDVLVNIHDTYTPEKKFWRRRSKSLE